MCKKLWYFLLVSLSLFSSSFVIAGPLETLQPKHWAAISLNTIRSINSCPANNCAWSGVQGIKAVIDVWNGGAFASGFGIKGGLIVWGGGHMAYYGSEVYVFSLDTLMWEQVSQPYNGKACDSILGSYPDGSPCAAHTYDYVDYHPGTNSFFMATSSGDVDVGGGAYTDYPYLFNLTTNKWRRGAKSSRGGGSMAGSTSAYDPSRDVFWFQPAYNKEFSKYDPNANSGAGQWTLYNTWNVETSGAAAITPVHDLYLLVDARADANVKAKQLSNPDAAPIVLNTVGDTEIQGVQQIGFEWDPDNQIFVAWSGGASIYTLTPPAVGLDWKTAPWVWTKVNPAATNTVTPTAVGVNGTYSRFRYAPYLKGFVLINHVDDPVFAYKMPTNNLSLSFGSDLYSVPSGTNINLSWTSTNATNCSAQGDWSGVKSFVGSEQAGPITAESIFILTCTNAGGSTSRTVRVSIEAPTIPGPVTPPTQPTGATISISAASSKLSVGEYAQLSWVSGNVDSCNASGDWSGQKPLQDSDVAVGPLEKSSEFILTCTSSSGQQSSDSINVAVLSNYDQAENAGSLDLAGLMFLNLAFLGRAVKFRIRRFNRLKNGWLARSGK